jgi:RNA recognition motif-containing protein
MRVTLYIGGLEEQVDDRELRRLFGEYGSIADTRVVIGDDGRCRGFAYVTFEDDLAAAKARVALDGKELDGRTLRVAMAT